MNRNNHLRSLRINIKLRDLSLINISGLSLGISCAIMILLYVRYELSYDKYHKNYNNIYRIAHTRPGHTYMGSDIFLTNPGTLKEALVMNIPEIEYATKFDTRPSVFEYNGQKVSEAGILFADPDFINVFSVDVVSGDLSACLSEPFSLFVTRRTAERYFGGENPLGKVIEGDNKYSYTVKGIIENVPDNSHFQYDFITGFESLYSIRGGKDRTDRWNSFSFQTYVKVYEEVSPEDIDDKLQAIVKTYLDEDMQELKILMHPLSGIHLGGNFNFGVGLQSDVKYFFLMSSIGIFILLLAIFNYINMASARSYSRGKEIGIKKVAGANKIDIVLQGLGEAIFHSFVALALAFIIILLVLPVFNNFVQRELSFTMIFESANIAWVLFIVLVSGILAGLYPANHMSKFNPVNLFSGAFDSFSGKHKTNRLRSTLVILQYTISLIAIVATITMLRQLGFINNMDLGFECDNIINIYVRDPVIRSNPNIIIDKLQSNPAILAVTTSTNIPARITSNHSAYWEGKEESDKLNIYRAGIDYSFFDFYGFNLLEGRKFFLERSADTLSRFIINQKAASLLGWDDPVGKRLSFDNEKESGVVIGLIEDFYFQSLYLPVEPLAFNTNMGGPELQGANYFSVKIIPIRLTETRKFIDDTFTAASPNYLNTSSILAERIERQYANDARLADILIFSTLLAILLACLGLYGLSSFTTRSRTKEMITRRILGLQPGGIMLLFSREFAKWILIAIVFAWPLSYILMARWLQNFAYHVDIGLLAFVISLFIAIIISILSMGWTVIKVAYLNPAAMLRSE